MFFFFKHMFHNFGPRNYQLTIRYVLRIPLKPLCHIVKLLISYFELLHNKLDIGELYRMQDYKKLAKLTMKLFQC